MADPIRDAMAKGMNTVQPQTQAQPVQPTQAPTQATSQVEAQKM